MLGSSFEEESSLAGKSRALSMLFFRRVFSRPFGRMALATEGRGLR